MCHQVIVNIANLKVHVKWKREVFDMKIDTNLHIIKKLTPKQQEIVDNMTYPNFVKAGAGTGKTEVVVQKILKLL